MSLPDIQRGNEGIDYGTWTGRTEPAERAPLPIYPNINEAERLEAQTR